MMTTHESNNIEWIIQVQGRQLEANHQSHSWTSKHICSQQPALNRALWVQGSRASSGTP